MTLNFNTSTSMTRNYPLSRNEFLIALEKNNITLDESRMAEVNYYFNLWGDTMKQDRKSGQTHDFDAYIAWMKKQ